MLKPHFAFIKGIKAVLEAKAQGYEELVKISNNKPELATSFLMIEKLETQLEKNKTPGSSSSKSSSSSSSFQSL